MVEADVTVTTAAGRIRGVVVDEALRFLGVPYGAAPIGERRFAPPQPRRPWRGTFDATRFGPRPPQPPTPVAIGAPVSPGPIDEDCLRVNIYTPGLDGARPVMVWLHGGGLAFGSANEYDGRTLAVEQDVVVVTVGYRLGLLGFADLSPCGSAFAGSASNGFRDQILALEWIRANISSFGGDADNVTLFGQSGGGLSILALLGAPAADGLFHRAIVLSAGPPQPEPPDVVAILGGTLDTAPDELPARLRSLPTDRILELQQGIGFTAGGSLDGTVVTQFPAEAILAKGADGIPIIAGTTRDEGTLLTAMMQGLRPEVLRVLAAGLAAGTFEGADPSEYLARLEAALGDADAAAFHTEVWTDHFRRTAIRVAEAACEAGPGGWLYRFDLQPDGPLGIELGVTHAADLGFVFGSVPPSDGTSLYDGSLADVATVGAAWSTTLASFARHGHPNVAAPDWCRYLPDRGCWIVDEHGHLGVDVDRDRQAVWGDRGSRARSG